jgi:hypothetical protein
VEKEEEIEEEIDGTELEQGGEGASPETEPTNE